MEWESLSFIPDTLVTYFFGSGGALGFGVLALFFITLTSVGLGFTLSFFLTLPLIAAFVIGGMFGVSVWILNLALVGAGIIYGGLLIRMLT